MRNLKDAALLGAVVGMMAIPRILASDGPHAMLIVAVFPAMTLVAGAATAWGRSCGMPGLFPERQLMLKGVIVAVFAAMLLIPFTGYFDEQLKELLQEAGKEQALELSFPTTILGCLAMILWGAGFETMYFRAGTISFLARISNRRWFALAGAVALRVMVSTTVGSGPELWLRLAAIAVVAGIGGLFYMRAGLPAAMTFIAVLDCRHLLRLLFD